MKRVNCLHFEARHETHGQNQDQKTSSIACEDVCQECGVPKGAGTHTAASLQPLLGPRQVGSSRSHGGPSDVKVTEDVIKAKESSFLFIPIHFHSFLFVSIHVYSFLSRFLSKSLLCLAS